MDRSKGGIEEERGKELESKKRKGGRKKEVKKETKAVY